MTMNEMKLGIEEPKPLGMMKLFLSKWQKPKAGTSKQQSSVKPWQNLARTVELPSRKWLENAQIGSDLPN